MSIFNYYRSFRDGIEDKEQNIEDYIILADSDVKNDLCNKIFNLLIKETYIYYNRLSADRKQKFTDFIGNEYDEGDISYPSEGVYNQNPFTGGRIYVNSDLDNSDDFFCLISEYDWQVYLDDNYDVIINPYGGVSTQTYYDVGLEIVNQFVDDINNQLDDCLLCCDKFYNLSKCFILYKMIDRLREAGKDKEVAFYLKYIACMLKTSDGYTEELIEYDLNVYTTDDYEQSQVEFVTKDPDPEEPWNPDPPPPDEPYIDPIPDPDPEPDVHTDNIDLYVVMSGTEICCIINDGEHYTAKLENGEVILDNLYNRYSIRRDSNDNIILY